MTSRLERILVVDDHPLNQQLAVLLLNQFRFDADIAASACEALKLYASNDYQLVLMDLQMPEVDGYEAAGQIRTIDSNIGRRVPIIAVTAGWNGNDQRHLEAGMDELLPKPIEPLELLKLLNKWLPPTAVHDANQPLLNIAALTQRLGDENVHRFLEMFATDYRGQIKLITEASADNNYAEVLSLAHRLRGACGAVSAVRLNMLCKTIADAGRVQDWTTVEHATRKIVENEGPAVLAFIECYLQYCCPVVQH